MAIFSRFSRFFIPFEPCKKSDIKRNAVIEKHKFQRSFSILTLGSSFSKLKPDGQKKK